jgi:hypothetical protein
MATDALRRAGRKGMMTTPPRTVVVRLAVVEAEHNTLIGTEQAVREVTANLRRLEVRRWLRVTAPEALDTPDWLLGIAWMKAGHRTRREIRTTLESKPDPVLSITVMCGPSGLLIEYAVVQAGEPHTVSEELVATAQLAFLPHGGEA